MLVCILVLDLPQGVPILANRKVLVPVWSRLWRAVIELGGYDRV